METKIYTYEFDCNNLLNKTIMERYESLLIFLSDINRRTEINYAITHPSIASIFETASVTFENAKNEFVYTPAVINIAGMLYCGQLSYPNERMNFELFKSQYMAEDELILCSKAGSSIVHFKNWV
jgi:hypothetical protein